MPVCGPLRPSLGRPLAPSRQNPKIPKKSLSQNRLCFVGYCWVFSGPTNVPQPSTEQTKGVNFTRLQIFVGTLPYIWGMFFSSLVAHIHCICSPLLTPLARVRASASLTRGLCFPLHWPLFAWTCPRPRGFTIKVKLQQSFLPGRREGRRGKTQQEPRYVQRWVLLGLAWFCKVLPGMDTVGRWVSPGLRRNTRSSAPSYPLFICPSLQPRRRIPMPTIPLSTMPLPTPHPRNPDPRAWPRTNHLHVIPRHSAVLAVPCVFKV